MAEGAESAERAEGVESADAAEAAAVQTEDVRAGDLATQDARTQAAGEDRADDELAGILSQCRTIAVVGIKDGPSEDAYRIPLYMQAHGYRIVPVNPKLDSVLGERAYPDLGGTADGGLELDLINLFRATHNVAAHVDEILALSPRPKVVWMQLGIHHGPSAARLREAGIRVVQDRCIMVDHRRLVACGAGAA